MVPSATTSLLVLCLCLSSVLAKEIVTSQINENATSTVPQGTKEVAEKTEGTQRACAACSGIDCDANMSISGLPIIQVFIAFGVGVLWAKLFVWFFKAFVEKSENETTSNMSPVAMSSSYGVPTQQYGMPQTQYGVAQSYGPPASQYGAPNSRALSTDFLSLTKTVLDAIKEFTES